MSYPELQRLRRDASPAWLPEYFAECAKELEATRAFIERMTQGVAVW